MGQPLLYGYPRAKEGLGEAGSVGINGGSERIKSSCDLQLHFNTTIYIFLQR